MPTDSPPLCDFVDADVLVEHAFAKLLRSEPQMAAILLRTLASRLRAAQEQY